MARFGLGRVIQLHLDPPIGGASSPALRSTSFEMEPWSTMAARRMSWTARFSLWHLVELLAADPLNPPLATGEIVTTGTLTRAFPVAKGEEWTTELTGIPLEGARIRFV